ncbi:MAG TPA: ABC transporter substrate-binding protein [Bacteroidales bacterium]|nr:ABC transporter substrate-binding protein [Bacteroidales bacterium]
MKKSRMLRGAVMGSCVLLFTMAFQSCPGPRNRSFRIRKLDEQSFVENNIEYVYKPLYANNFFIAREEGEKVLYLKDPVSKSETRHVIHKVKRVVCLSTTHIAYLDAINETRSIVGVSGSQYIYNDKLRNATDVGYESAIDYESLMALEPDVVFAYAVPGQPADYIQKIRQLGINVVEVPEHLEDHPLGKAEFLVAFAAFFDKEVMAMEQFHWIYQTYEEYRLLARQAVTLTERRKAVENSLGTDSLNINALNTTFKPVKVLINAPFKDIWYVPGTESHLHILIRDAGGVILGSEPGKKTTVMSTEQAYIHALEADFWLHPNQFSDLSSLAALDQRFAEVDVFRTGNVWNNNLRSTPEGGSDYFESGAVSPHLILADLIAIFYPDALPKHKFVYYKKLD